MKMLAFFLNLPEAWAQRYTSRLEKRRTGTSYNIAWLFIIAALGNVQLGLQNHSVWNYFFALLMAFMNYAFLTAESSARRIQELKNQSEAKSGG
jgi:hypothetical protein